MEIGYKLEQNKDYSQAFLFFHKAFGESENNLFHSIGKLPIIAIKERYIKYQHAQEVKRLINEVFETLIKPEYVKKIRNQGGNFLKIC